jgi:hypothetical protein
MSDVEKIAIPDILNTGAFRKTWVDWQTHRRQIGHRLTALAAEKQLKELACAGENAAIRMIEQSIKNGWQGLFEPKGPHGNQPQGKPDRDPRFFPEDLTLTPTIVGGERVGTEKK